MSQYVDWTATPVSMWIYGNVWECEWKWCVDKVVVISVSIIRLVHTQMILVAAPASDRYRRDSLRRMCFVACLSREKNICRDKTDTCSSSPQWNLSCPFICKAWKGCHRRLTVLLSVRTGSWMVYCAYVLLSHNGDFLVCCCFSPKYETLVHSLATAKLTQFVFLISCNPLRPIV